ncbi:D-glucuronyl C5-epimerase family protein [Phytohabitans rumicis]|uniref:D-glucuronyl C5-epimerase C-terminal domain-containing protein n=1 Tax=Phytohabitans rumicis TaxID=1076125 RepID=A0A6V8KXE4_9ACTN|nr:D-glucuronyl C5-epimerase family protein [Phytohabitans rumicis]GFJ88514.1 hypothetical protein Prum_021560 [Phytohabitans rumicis]
MYALSAAGVALVMAMTAAGPTVLHDRVAVASERVVAAPAPDAPIGDVDLTDVPMEGTALPPRADVAAAKARQRRVGAAATAAAAAPVTGFRTTGFTLRDVPAALLPYANEKITPRVDPGVHDATGVRMFVVNGQLYNHPVAQAQYGLINMNAYRLTKDRFYLDRAGLQAQRLIDTRVESAGAWWYPYDFDFAVHGDTAHLLTAPWYSDMAQGQALSLYVMLFEATGASAWKAAADATFLSLSLDVDPAQPWGSWVDSSGNLWLEEYPRLPAANSERVLNGHLFAAFGLFDYHRITAAPRAAELYDGALTTVLNTLPTGFRRPNWASLYSLFHRIPSRNYHQVHISELLAVQRQTWDLRFARFAETLRADYPAPRFDRTLRFAAGDHTFRTFDTSGRITGTRYASFGRATAAPASHRQRIEGRGIFLRVSAGPYQGWWVAESRPARYLVGPLVVLSYLPGRWLTILPGAHSFYRYDANSRPTGSRNTTFAAPSGAPFTASAIVDGRLAVRVSAGPYTGYWLPVTSKVQLDSDQR